MNFPHPVIIPLLAFPWLQSQAGHITFMHLCVECFGVEPGTGPLGQVQLGMTSLSSQE